MLGFKPVIWRESSRYQEFKPTGALRPHIDCYWINLSEEAGQSRIIPDLCADFIMTFTPDYTFKQLRYSGPNTRYFMSLNDQEITLGIRFHLASLRNWLPQDLSQTKNQLLQDWDGSRFFADALFEVLESHPSLAQLLAFFDDFFLKGLSQTKSRPSALVSNIINNSLELVDYREVIQREVLSERTIQRVFRQETGLSPYEVHDIIRFQQTLQSMIQLPGTSLTELALRNGYYDQAHYTRRFKLISGLTPTDIRQNWRKYPRQIDGNSLN